MAIHHNSIRKYTAALLNLFNNLEVEYKDSVGATHVKPVPITYSSKEKSQILDSYTEEQLLSGNYNVLPRANLGLSTMVKSEQRVMNKNLKINTSRTDTKYSFQWNSVPYEFTFELSVACRGMNEAAIIIEQIGPWFNPTANIDVWDAENMDEPTRIPIKLLDIGIEQEEYEDISSNLVYVSVGISLIGSLYSPIKEVDKIKEFEIYINEQDGDFFSTKEIMGWDVVDTLPTNLTITEPE